MLSTQNIIRRLFNHVYFAFYSRKIHKKLTSYLARAKRPIVIVNNAKVLSFLYPKPEGTRIVLFAQGWFIQQQISHRNRWLFQTLVDKYACVSWATLQAIYGANLTSLKDLYVVHNAIESNKLKGEGCSEERAELNILLSGGFLPTKGQLTAIHIAEELKAKGIHFRMLLTGIIYKGEKSRPYYEYLEELIQQKGLQDHVKTVVGLNNVYDYFRWCDLLIHPSDTEGLPRVVMEAMALKKPVIANAVGGVTDYVINGYTGFLTHYNDVDEYVNKILLLHTNRTLYDTITTNAYQMVTTAYTPEAQMEQMNQLLEKL